MPKTELLSSAESAAHAAKLASVGHFSYSSDSMATDALRKLCDSKYHCDFYEACSEESLVSSAFAAAALGKRTMASFSGSGGVAAASSLRLPVVFLSSLEQALSCRDSGCIIFMPESNQEIMDSIIQACKISESAGLPSVVGIDDLSFMEPVTLHTEQFCASFIPKTRPKYNPKNPESIPGATKAEQQIAMRNAAKLIPKIDEAWKRLKRSGGYSEKFLLDDADYVFIVYGSDSMTAKAAITKMRAAGEKVGLLRLRIIRPWMEFGLPGKKAAVIDRSVSLGKAGVLHSEIGNKNYSNFISFRKLAENDFFEMLKKMKSLESPERIWIE